MKKLILAGIVIIIGCLIFIIIQQNTSRADMGFMDVYTKIYSVPFGDWVTLWLMQYRNHESGYDGYAVIPHPVLIENKVRYKIIIVYNSRSEDSKSWYNEAFPVLKEEIRRKCEQWTAQGYPISLNDFEFDIQAIQ